MKKYLVTFPKVSGIVVYGFKNGILCYFSNEADMEIAQQEWVLKHVPIKIGILEELKALTKCVINEVPEDLSFGQFWTQYGKKINRKRCEPLWNRLSDSQRSQCLMSLAQYDGFLKRNPGRPKMDPETYLRNESWTNNWAAL